MLLPSKTYQLTFQLVQNLPFSASRCWIPIKFDQISFSFLFLSRRPSHLHRWVINVKFVATPERSFDGGTFTRQIGLPPVQSRQSAVMERQRRRLGQNLESLITDPRLKISDPDTLHSAHPTAHDRLVVGNWREHTYSGCSIWCRVLYLHIIFSVQSICREQ